MIKVGIQNRAITIEVMTPDKAHAVMVPGEARDLAIRLFVAAGEAELNDLRATAGKPQFCGPVNSSRVILMPHQYEPEPDEKVCDTGITGFCVTCRLPYIDAVHA